MLCDLTQMRRSRVQGLSACARAHKMNLKQGALVHAVLAHTRENRAHTRLRTCALAALCRAHCEGAPISTTPEFPPLHPLPM
eukprot:3877840-Pleurochrysis_carterae.AAC.2